jgi:multicomponent Na+:H+ antiporter subunit C
MELALAVVLGGLYTAGIYMLLRRTLVKLLIGLVLLSNEVNLLIFTAAGLTRGQSPVIPAGAAELPLPAADPLPQALMLMAIVIGFGVTAFALVLGYRVYRTVGMIDLDQVREQGTEAEADAEPESLVTSPQGPP